MNEQLMYKLAALDAAVQGGFRRLDEKMDRFQSDLHDSQIATNDRINELDKEVTARFEFKRQRIDNMIKEADVSRARTDDRLVALETWRQVALAQVGVAMTVVAIIWVVLAPSIRALLGIANG